MGEVLQRAIPLEKRVDDQRGDNESAALIPSSGKVVPIMLGGLSLSFFLEMVSRLAPTSSAEMNTAVSALSLLAVFVFVATGYFVLAQVKSRHRANWTVAAGLALLVITQTVSFSASVPSLNDVAVLGRNSPLHDPIAEFSFVGGMVLLVAGFYFLIIELGVARQRLEREDVRMKEESEERLHILAALHDSKERYSKIFSNTEEGIVLLNEEMKLVQFNPRFANMLGLTPGELTGMDPVEMIHEDDRAMVRDQHARLMIGQEVPRSYEFRLVDRRGRIIYVSGSFDLIKRENEILCSHGILRDITQRNQAQEAQLFRLQLESIISATSTNFISRPSSAIDENIETALRSVCEFAMADRAFVFQLDNDRNEMEYSHEWSRDAINAAPRSDRKLPLKNAPGLGRNLNDESVFMIPSVGLVSDEDSVDREELLSYGVKSFYAVPMRFESKLVGFLGIDYTRTEMDLHGDTVSLLKTVGEILAGAVVRRRTEGALRRSEEKYRSILESIEEGYYEIDTRGRFSFFNDSICTITGYSAVDVREILYTDLFSEGTGEQVAERFRKMVQTGLPLEPSEWPFIRKDGTEGFMEISGALVVDDDYQPLGFRGMIRDITEKHNAEEERRQFEAQVQHTQKLESLGILAGGIAHDFNNLLMGVMANAALALDEVTEDMPGHNSLQQIELSAQRAADLANQMLTYSGKGKFAIKPLDLSCLVEEMAHLLEVSTSKKASLVYHFDRTLPAIEGDATQLRQVIMNLITNASDAIRETGGLIEVTTKVVHVDDAFFGETMYHYDLSEDDYVCLEVIDEGCGMDEETLERIFDPFFTSKVSGRGLGLASVIGIVRGHHGAIKVDTKPESGTKFTVVFPISSQPKPLPPAPVSSDALEGEGTILVIDDEPLIIDVSKRILERAGYEVLTAEDGEVGLKVYEEHHGEIDIVLLDMTMPNMDGISTYHELAKIKNDIAVVFTSGFSEDEAQEQYGAARPLGFIQKPYRGAELLSRIQKAMLGPKKSPV